MSVQRPSSPQVESDLEVTAELPVLDVAAYEAATASDEHLGHSDTWIIPAGAVRVPPQAAGAGTAPSAPSASSDASRLEVSLNALSANLRDVEERLTRKGERLAAIERALAEAQAERTAAEQRAKHLAAELEAARASASATQAQAAELKCVLDERDASGQTLQAHDKAFEEQLAAHDRALALLQRDLSDARTRAATYLEALQSAESRRTTFEDVLWSLRREIDERDSRVSHLQNEVDSRGTRLGELESDLSARAARIAKLESEVNSLAAALAQRDEQLHEAKQAGDELRRSVASLKESRAASVESLESSLAAAVERGDAQEAAARTAQGRCEELETTLGGQKRRADQFEAELTMVRVELQERSTALQEANAERNEQIARITAGDARIQELGERVEEQQDTVRVLQADTNASVARAKELEGDLRAAEDAINRLESELRIKTARLEELEKTNQEWRATVEEARHALTDRDSLIHRLEEETANSAVLLGAIQQSITKLDPSPAGHDPAPDGATRLLIRADGDSDVVHVLGRKTSVGRTPDNDLQIDARFISRHHAVILAGPAHTIIEDLNSTNGVLVNSRRITRQTLKDGDVVVIGKTQFRFAVRAMSEKR